MPPKLEQAEPIATPQMYGVKLRCIQASGIFRLPAELIIEILSCFGDPRDNIRCEKSGRGSGALVQEHVERLTAIRKLTMTCWHLRNMLLPLLWEYVEGCNLYVRRPARNGSTSYQMVPLENGLYDQCLYLVQNPAIGAYVQALSVDLCLTEATKDLMTIFIDCLVRLPNLITLDVFNTSDISRVACGLEWTCARFPNIRELWVHGVSVVFIESCPNVESVTTTGVYPLNIEFLCAHGKKLKRLKRVAGIPKEYVHQGEPRGTSFPGCPFTKVIAMEVVQVWPGLQEIGIKDTIGSIPNIRAAKYLRSLKHLAIVELDFIHPFRLDEVGTTRGKLYRAETKRELKAWKRRVIEVLKNSPSKKRKFLRWKIYEGQRCDSVSGSVLVEEGEFEVLPETSL